MMQMIVGAVAGVIFGLGLMLSGMARPEVVLGFLDPLGAWNPALGFVMAGAIPLAAIGFWLARRRGRCWCEPALHLPAAGRIDARLVVGAAIFGLGWGLAGVCPAPALTLLARDPIAALAFLVPMMIGLFLAPRLRLPAASSGPTGHASTTAGPAGLAAGR